VWRYLILTAVVASVAGAWYVASPMVSAWSLREAIRTNDVDFIRGKVDWPRVQTTMRQSLARQADILPVAYRPRPRRTLWQSVKAWFARPMIDRFIARYITPEGLPKLYEMRATSVRQGASDYAQPDRRWRTRLRHFVARIKRAEFTGWTTFALELRDKAEPQRVYLSVFQLQKLSWKLVTLRVLRAADAGPRIAAAQT